MNDRATRAGAVREFQKHIARAVKEIEQV